MYLIVIAWIYVVLMMSVAEATNSNGTLLGALVTFVFYGVAPVALVVYLMGAPARSRAIKKREAEAHAARMASGNPEAETKADTGTHTDTEPPSVQPDAGSHAPGGAEAVSTDTGIAPVGKKP